jgi:Tol biopolymer transport system component
VFVCEGDRVFNICSRRPNSSEPAATLLASAVDTEPYSFSSDGNRLILLELGDERRFLSLDLTDFSAPPDPLEVAGTGRISAPALSPDGRWLAYVSNENGLREVWVESLDSLLSDRFVVSGSGGGITPLWTKGGQELVYRGSLEDRFVFARAFNPSSGDLGAPEQLFPDNYLRSSPPRLREWDVTPDGQRFIMIQVPEDRRPRRLVIIVNFFELLKERMEN